MAEIQNSEALPIPTEGTKQRAVYQFSPLDDPRWPAFVDSHPRASVFHTVAWIEALRRTYGYEPVAFTTSPPDTTLAEAIVLCRVASWITGRRMVSLPFSDHCELLVDEVLGERVLLSALEQTLRRERLRYIELRPLRPLADAQHRPAVAFCFHRLDLRPGLTTLFANCHKSSTQRKILRAGREGLICETGRSEALIEAFWNLFLLTRRRHGVPPQPKAWFRNLVGCFGDALQVRVAFKDKQPVAAILTIRHNGTLVYKYGCSDAAFNNLGGTQLLFWKAIEEGKRDGLSVFDLGRSECDNTGLIAFKDRWGAVRSELTYSRIVAAGNSKSSRRSAVSAWMAGGAKRVAASLPDRVFSLAGRLLYRHIA